MRAQRARSGGTRWSQAPATSVLAHDAVWRTSPHRSIPSVRHGAFDEVSGGVGWHNEPCDRRRCAERRKGFSAMRMLLASFSSFYQAIRPTPCTRRQCALPTWHSCGPHRPTQVADEHVDRTKATSTFTASFSTWRPGRLLIRSGLPWPLVAQSAQWSFDVHPSTNPPPASIASATGRTQPTQ